MKTRNADELMKKVQKGATAGFNVQDWLFILDTLGGWLWTSSVVDREHQYLIKNAKTGASFKLKKEPGYRCIVFYGKDGFEAWAKHNGLMQQIEERIGPAPRKKTRQETEANTGTCPCCFGGFKLKDVSGNPGMVLHGYRRPGWGYVVGNCHGVDYLPYELSCAGTRAIRELATSHVNMLEAQLGLLRAEPAELYIAGRSKETRVVKKGDAGYAYELGSKIQHTEWEIRQVRKDIELFTAKINTWTLQPLPGTVRS